MVTTTSNDFFFICITGMDDMDDIEEVDPLTLETLDIEIKEEPDNVNDNDNPWSVKSLEDFLQYCCPECDNKSQSKELFVHHAVLEHPQSVTTLSQMVTLSDYLVPKDAAVESDTNIEELEEEKAVDDDDSEDDHTWRVIAAKKAGIWRRGSQCYRCGEKFKTKAEVIKHIKVDHKTQARKISFGPIKADVFDKQCYFCTKMFTAFSITKHMNDAHGDKIYEQFGFGPRKEFANDIQCYYCGDMFSYPQEVDDHQLEKHVSRRITSMQGPARDLKCQTCGKMFADQESMDRHDCHTMGKMDMVKDDNGFYNCPDCDFKFTRPQYLQRHHISKHRVLRSFMCKECDFKAKSAKCLKQHVQRVHEKLLKSFCHQCGKGFYSNWALNTHIKGVHQGLKLRQLKSGITFPCLLCPKVFNDNNGHRQHITKTHGADPSDCTYCKRPFTVLGMDNHLKMDHPNEIALMEVDGSCSDCGQFYDNAKDLSNHVRQDHVDSIFYKCYLCGEQLHGSPALKKHFADAHQKLVLTCQKCPLITKFDSVLKKHVASFHECQEKEGPIYACNLCGMYLTDLKMHLANQHPEEWRGCDSCDIFLEGTDDYIEHFVNIHEQTKEEINAHTMFHPRKRVAKPGPRKSTKPGPVVCPQCDVQFFSKQGMDKHVKAIHTMVKDNLCHMCDFKTSHPSSLRKHIESKHLKTNTFCCEKCPYKTYHASHLSNHIRMVHDKVKSHKCHLCDAAYSYGRDLVKHKYRVHPELRDEQEPIAPATEEQIQYLTTVNENQSQST